MKIVKLFSLLSLTFLAGFIGQIFTMPSIPTWYAALNKPGFSPPNWIFAPAWTTLYILMAISAWLVWQKGLEQKEAKVGLVLFFIQLVLNSFWSIIFFGWHLPFLALVELVVLWLVILLTIIYFEKVSKPAAWLLVPYIVWVSFASVLNLMIVLLN